MDRRTFLAAGAALSIASAVNAQAPAAASPEDRVRAAARDARQRLAFDGRSYSGPAYGWLVAQGREARFFALGEEHGIAENPKLAAQLFRDLVPAGYRHAAIEISPPMATELDRAAAAGMPALRRFLTTPGRQVAFFGMREEAEWIAAARAAVPGRTPVLWGTDYEVFADRHLIASLKAMRKPAAAEAALARVEQVSAEAWARQARTGDLLQIYPFSGDPEPVRALRAAWPQAGPDAGWIIDTLEETLEINGLYRARQGYASNARRAALLRRNFLRHWQQVAASSNPPRVFLKFGSTHVVRGLTQVGTFDKGALIAELAVLCGERSFHLLVLPGNDAQTAVFDPATLKSKPSAPKDMYQKGLGWMIDEAWPDAFTLFDTHKLRQAVYGARNADPELVRAVFGYDAVLVMSGSTASSNL
jgi:hypothetical protein